MIIPEGAGFNPCGLAQARLVATDFDKIPFLLTNGDHRPLATRRGDHAARDILNASKSSPAGPAVATDAELVGPVFNSQTHMNMVGIDNLLMFDLTLKWATDNIKNPVAANICEQDSASD